MEKLDILNAFKQIINKHGLDILKDKDKITGIIQDVIPNKKEQILIRNAFDIGVVDLLLNASKNNLDEQSKKELLTKASNLLIENAGTDKILACDCVNIFAEILFGITLPINSIDNKKNKTVVIDPSSTKESQVQDDDIVISKSSSDEKTSISTNLSNKKTIIVAISVFLLIVLIIAMPKNSAINNSSVNESKGIAKEDNKISNSDSFMNKLLEMQKTDKLRLEHRYAEEEADKGLPIEVRKAKQAEYILSDMVKCPAGSFIMGSPKNEKGRNEDEKQHKVTFTKDFYIGKYEITVQQYWTVLGLIDMMSIPEKRNPVTTMPIMQHQKFISELNKLTEKTRPAGYVFDMPTEAQWEYACRAGSLTALNTNKVFSENNLSEVAWYKNNTDNYHKSVGLKLPNAWGIYDMHGNVSEICKDFYGEYPSSDSVDPECSEKGNHVVCRGGSFGSLPEKCRIAARNFVSYDSAGFDVGLRLALVPSASKDKYESNLKLINKKDFKINNLILEMRYCPAGSVVMGGPEGECGRFNAILKKVNISNDFYMSRYEITQELYESVMGQNNSKEKNKLYPITHVNWNEAVEFCNKLNVLTEGQREPGYEFDLPTDAQWEYACRAGTTSSLNSGNNLEKSMLGTSKNLDLLGWYSLNSAGQLHEVGLKKPNSWGLYDMHGNVKEWCKDYSKYILIKDEEITDPIGDLNSTSASIRGGSYNTLPESCVSAYQTSDSKNSSSLNNRDSGIRVALVKKK